MTTAILRLLAGPVQKWPGEVSPSMVDTYPLNQHKPQFFVYLVDAFVYRIRKCSEMLRTRYLAAAQMGQARELALMEGLAKVREIGMKQMQEEEEYRLERRAAMLYGYFKTWKTL